MVLLRLFVVLTLFGTSAVATELRTISVTGVGEVSMVPDMATIRAGVQTQDRRADVAIRENSEVMAQVFEQLKRANIAEKDIQTADLSLFPQYDNRSSGQGVGISHYVAQNTLIVRVRDLEALGAILDGINKSGVNRINGISFGMQNSDAAMENARKAAVADAMAKAELYAAAAGVVLGPLQSLTEPGAGSPVPRPMAMARAESMAMDVPIAQGEVSLSARVHMVFAIE